MQIIKPVEGINTDIASKYLKGTQARFILNMERHINRGRGGQLGYNSSVSTPGYGNFPVSYTQPAGFNKPIGRYYAKRTSEVYVWVYNSLGNHHIYRVNRNNTIDIILQDPLLNFSPNKRYRIRHAHLFFNYNTSIEEQSGVHHKYLVWTEGSNWQGFLDVETSLATNSFSVPYFNTADRAQLWQLAPRPSLVCPYGAYDRVNIDLEKSNLIKDRTWQFRIQFIYTDGRESAWSPISEMFVEGNTCRVNPRCIDLWLDAGGPQVEKVRIAFRNCVGAVTADQAPEWFECDVVSKYDICLDSGLPFYERTIHFNSGENEYDYDATNNLFHYHFCNEGTCLPIDRAETNLNYNAIPKYSYCLMPMENKVALVNNIWGDDPIDCEEVSKITFETEGRPDEKVCQPVMVTLQVALVVHNQYNGINQPVWVYEKIATDKDWEGKTVHFGGLFSSKEFRVEHWFQSFAETAKELDDDVGFIIYVEGTEAFGVTKQYKVMADGTRTQIRPLDDWETESTRDAEFTAINNNDYYYAQIAEIQVPMGTQGWLRVASHLKKTSDDFRKSSAQIAGIVAEGHYIGGSALQPDDIAVLGPELWFDTCHDVKDDNTLDLTGTPIFLYDFVADKNNVIFGYVTDEEGRPVEGALPSGGGNHNPMTDANGYYFSSNVDTDARVNIMVEGDPDCAAAVIGVSYSSPKSKQQDLTVTTRDYTSDYMQPVAVKVTDEFGQPVIGVTVAIEYAKAQVTGSDGKAYFNLRHRMTNLPLTTYYPGADPRKIVLMQSGVCFMTTGDCDPCMPTTVVTLPDCLKGAGEVPPDSDGFSGASRAFPGINIPPVEHGWHPGGVYPLAVKLADAAGRETAAEKIGTIELPTVQKLQKYAFTDIKFNLNGFTAPPEYVRLSLLIGVNRAFDDYVTWVADKVEFVDSSGTAATKTSATKILLSIRSLYDNANIAAYGTNVKYSWVQGDKVEIIANGDGTIYPNVMQFNIEADYNNLQQTVLAEGEERYNKLVIGYTGALADLTAGAQIKLIRQGECQNTELYFETCQTIELANGVPQVTTGILSGWDTYMVRRGIRWDDQTHEFELPFLHHSPSDYWGDHCASRGRVSYPNIYTKRLQYGREMRLSNSFLENSNYNGLGTFSLPKKTFTGEQRGDITYVISREQIFMMICEHDNFIVNSATEFVRVDPSSGQVVALPPDALVSDAQSKISGNWGCRYEDTGSVVVGDSWVFWVDVFNKLPVIHDWQQARDASQHPQDGSQTQSYWKQKLQALGEKDIVAGYDPIGPEGSVMITFFGEPLYCHSKKEFDYPGNETIAFSLLDFRWPTMHGFTPEDYVYFPSNAEGDIFITFKDAKPWIHRALNTSADWNTFYGISSDEIFEFIINEVPEKAKHFVAMQLQTDTPWFADRIISSLGHTSILPPVFCNKLTEGKYDAHFLMDDRRDLFNGPPLRGNWLQVRLIRDNTQANAWNTVDAAKQKLYSEFDRIITRYAFSEQSAYNTNNQG